MKNKYDMSVLYVEDDDSIREELSYFLSRKIKTLHIAKNGDEGVKLYKEFNPDLVITDINMPRLDGISMSRMIKKYDLNARIIMLTAFNEADYLIEAVNLGIDNYLIKPTNLVKLQENIDKIYKTINLENENKRILNLLEQYKHIVDLSNIVSKTDANGKITYANKKFETISGYSKEELLGHSHNIIRHEDVPKDLFEDLWYTIKDKKSPWFGTLKNRKKDGNIYYVDTVINPIFDSNGEVYEYIGIRHDITDIMSPKKQLIDDMKSMEYPLLILSKIANYKIIKEFYSEELREKFIEEFSKKLLKYFPSHLGIKKVYVLGNGFFGFLKNDKYNEDHINLYLTKVLNEVRKEDFEFEGNKYELDVIFSFAYNGVNLFDDASIGIHKIEKSKKSIIFADNFYKKKQQEAKRKLQTLNLIKEAIKDNRVLSYFQPIICNKTNEIVKYESLIRIINNDEEILSPFHFMDIAKKTGYYHDLTKEVIVNAQQVLDSNTEINISINIAYSDIEDLEIRDLLFNLVSKDENKGRITFELLEDEESSDISEIKSFVDLVKLLSDVKISIDDFGSGYSNYERLSQFQPDFIKIDASLIKNITTNKYNESVVKSIVLFAKENSIKTIAEYVANEDILNKVKSLGIDYSQGYFLGKPEPLEL